MASPLLTPDLIALKKVFATPLDSLAFAIHESWNVTWGVRIDSSQKVKCGLSMWFFFPLVDAIAGLAFAACAYVAYGFTIGSRGSGGGPGGRVLAF